MNKIGIGARLIDFHLKQTKMIFKRQYYIDIAVCRHDFAQHENTYLNQEYVHIYAHGSCLYVILNLRCCIGVMNDLGTEAYSNVRTRGR